MQHIPQFLTEMVHSCAVLGCKNRSNKEECKGLKFYTLPFRNEELLKTWLALICRRRNEVTIHSRVCSAHFAGGIKKNDSLPQIFPLQKCIPTQVPAPATIPSDIVDHDHCYCSLDFQSVTPSIVLHPGSSYLTPILASDIIPLQTPTCHRLTIDAATLTDLSIQPTSSFCIELFTNNNDAIQFYTGFESYDMLISCFKFLGDDVNHLQYKDTSAESSTRMHSEETRGAPRSLTPLNEFFLVLCRLRCALLVNDIAYRFGVLRATVCRIFTTWINFLYYSFKEINIWPSRQQIDDFMPQAFKDIYPTTRCIIDATEIFIQTPSNPQAQQLTFSSYKNHNTLKSLVAITPSGGVCFVSKLYGGNISDRELTERCGILSLLEPGDSIMADRGFTIADLLELKGVALNIPPMKTSDQFTQRELTITRRIANLRIHVERAIGRIKNFKLLNDNPNNMARVADQIFFVCAFLSNFHGPLCNSDKKN